MRASFLVYVLVLILIVFGAVQIAKRSYENDKIKLGDSCKELHYKYDIISRRCVDIARRNRVLSERYDSIVAKNSELSQLVETCLGRHKYYIIGSETVLYNKKLIIRVSGLSQEMKINPEVGLESFKWMRRYSTDTIKVVGKRVKVIGNFPKTAYKITGDDDDELHYLIIMDRYKFWAGNRLLVITYR